MRVQSIISLFFIGKIIAQTNLTIGIIMRPDLWTVDTELIGDVYPEDLLLLAETAMQCV